MANSSLVEECVVPKPLPFVVAGHLCLDLTPALDVVRLPEPGSLVKAGPLHVSTGGAVANVGFALSRLGFEVRLAGLIGDDWTGELLSRLLLPLGEQSGVRIAPKRITSYSVVLTTQGRDRAFLHCSGPNEIFTSADVRDQDLAGAGWLHFGYPPLMPAIAAQDGKELTNLLGRARSRGLRTSLDFCSMDSATEFTNWPAVLRNCAELVTVFAPSIEELRIALRFPTKEAGNLSDVRTLAHRLIDMGFAVVVIKLGIDGLYLRTTYSSDDLGRWRLGPEWCDLEFAVPCFRADFINATGAGDCAIAGLIASIASGDGPEEAATIAAATGASSVETPDASSGVPLMADLHERIHAGWERLGTRASIQLRP